MVEDLADRQKVPASSENYNRTLDPGLSTARDFLLQKIFERGQEQKTNQCIKNQHENQNTLKTSSRKPKHHHSRRIYVSRESKKPNADFVREGSRPVLEMSNIADIRVRSSRSRVKRNPLQASRKQLTRDHHKC
jgi:hypothetical protein